MLHCRLHVRGWIKPTRKSARKKPGHYDSDRLFKIKEAGDSSGEAKLNTSELFDQLPIGAIYIITVLVLLLALEGGYRLGVSFEKRWPDQDVAEVNTMVAASLAFLGFLLAFIIGMAVSLFNERLHLVIDEANAIGTTYLRAGYVEEPVSSESRQLLREYIDQRLALTQPGQFDKAVARSQQIQDDLWKRAEILAKDSPDPVTALYISALNEMIDLHTERLIIRFYIRIPELVILSLYLVGILTMALIGVQGSYTGKRNYLALILTVLILSVVFLLIIDLDRPNQGLIQIPQKALLDLQQQLRTQP
jgi:hypothetical protein